NFGIGLRPALGLGIPSPFLAAHRTHRYSRRSHSRGRVAARGPAPTFIGFSPYFSLALRADHWARTAAAWVRARAHAASSAAVGAISEPCMAMAAAMASP